MKINDIYSALPIGNELDIYMRQASPTLSFVALTNYSWYWIVVINTMNIELGAYTLKLESYDNNSSVKSTLKTDTILFDIINCYNT